MTVELQKDVSYLDLIAATRFLHKIKPETRDKFVIGVEEVQPNDMNIVFRLLPIEVTSDGEEETVVYISSQYVIDLHANGTLQTFFDEPPSS